MELSAVAHSTPAPQAFVGQRLSYLLPQRAASSHEGIALSVTYPNPEIIEAWQYIARLGATTAVELRHADGSAGHFVEWSPTLERNVLQWAQGSWLVPQAGWRVSWIDADDGVQHWFEFDDFTTAKLEAEDLREQQNDDVEITATPRWHPTPLLVQHWSYHFTAPPQPEDALVEAANLYVAFEKPVADGLWWNETLDPVALSAPRGSILPHALPRWVGTQVITL